MFTSTVTASAGTPVGRVEFIDFTTGAALGAGVPAVSGANSATWTFAVPPRLLQRTGNGPDDIRAVFTPASLSFFGSFGSLPGGLTVSPIPLTFTGLTAKDKVYDQTTVATLDTSGVILAGLLGGDGVTLSTGSASANFATKDAGTGIAVTVSGLTLGGPQAVDYQFSQTATTLAANIAPAPLTVTGITAADKPYDGTATANVDVTHAALGGAIGGDDVALVTTGASGAFADPGPANNSPIVVSRLSLIGAKTGDYALLAPKVAANITLTPGSISDFGTRTLFIALGANQSLSIVSKGSSYAFSTNQGLVARSLTDPANQGAAFKGLATSGFGTTSPVLTAVGIAQYSSIDIVDEGANDSVTFNDSGSNPYADNFSVSLSHVGSGAITFNGGSQFGTFNLQAATARNVLVPFGASITSTSGNLTLRGNLQTAPTSGPFSGVQIAGKVQSTGGGAITLQGVGGNGNSVDAGVFILQGTVASETGNIVITGTGGNAGNTNVAGVWSSGTISSNGGNIELDGIDGNSTTGNGAGVTVDLGQIHVGGAGTLSIAGAASPSNTANAGVDLRGQLTTAGGNVRIIAGVGGVTLGVPGRLSQGITAGGSGSIFIQGATGITTTDTITTNNGDIQLVGQAGPINLPNGKILAGGSGNVTVTGIGGPPQLGRSVGVYLTGGSIDATTGNIQVTGQGGGGLQADYGIDVAGGQIGSGGNVQLISSVGGVDIEQNVFVSGGNVTIQGTGTARTGSGVTVSGTVAVTTGNVTIRGQANQAAVAVALGSGTIFSSGKGARFTIFGDTITTGALSAQGGIISLLPLTNGLPINLGSTDPPFAPGNFLLSHQIGGNLQIGDANSGDLTLGSRLNLGLPSVSHLSLASGRDINLQEQSLSTTFGGITLTPGATGAIRTPLNSPIGFIVNYINGTGLDFGPASNFALVFNADNSFNQLTVQQAKINLTGVNLQLSGTLAPLVGQTFTIVKTFSTPPIVGTFNGLPEGAVIPNFLGSPLSASITYSGNKAHDVVLTVLPPTTTAISASASTSLYDQSVTFNAQVTAPNGGTSAALAKGHVDFIDDTTGTDLGQGIFQTSGANAATWTLTTAAKQLQASPGAQSIRAVFTSADSTLSTSQGTLPGGLTVSPLPLTIVANITAADKTYDATTAATVNITSASLSGILPGDTVSLDPSVAVGTFASPTVGTATPVTISGLALTGPQANDYVVAPPSATASITPAPLTVTASANTKVYDGTIAAAALPTVMGLQGGDTPIFKEVYANPNPGTGIKLTPFGTVNDGNGGGNYSYTFVSTNTGTIAPPRASITYKSGYASLTEPAPGTTAPYYFTIALNGVSPKPVTIYYQTRNGSAQAGEDYRGVSNYRVIFPAFAHGATANTPPSMDIAITVNGDTTDGTDPETFSVVLRSAFNATLDAGGKTATGTIVQATAAAATKVSIADFSVAGPSAGTMVAYVPVTLNGPAAQAITLYYSTSDKTAKAGTDYVAQTNGHITIAPGETSVDIPVTILADAAAHGNVTFTITLSSSVNVVLASTTATVTIAFPPVASAAATYADAPDSLPTSTTMATDELDQVFAEMGTEKVKI